MVVMVQRLQSGQPRDSPDQPHDGGQAGRAEAARGAAAQAGSVKHVPCSLESHEAGSDRHLKSQS